MNFFKNDLKIYVWIAVAVCAYIFFDNIFFGGKCPFLYVCGIQCCGCGMTRAVAALMKGDIISSVKYHLFGIIFVMYGMYFIFFRYMQKKSMSFFAVSACIITVAYILYYIIRIIKYF
jgi:hypothetical protein